MPTSDRKFATPAGPVTVSAVRLLSILLLCIGVAASTSAWATAPERWSSLAHTPFKHVIGANASGVSVITQDLDGFLWLGTQAGLVRWDGYKLRRYAANSQRKDALPDGFIFSVHVDPRGRLWAGTSAGGLVRYDAARDNFVQYPAGPQGISHARVSALAGDGAGGVWIGTAGGLDHISAQGKLTRAGEGNGTVAGAGLPQGGVEAMLRDRRGNLWIGTGQGLLMRAAGTTGLQRMALLPGDQPQPSVNALYQDSAGRVWVGTRTRGAMTFAEGSLMAQAVRESGPASTIESERVLAIVEVGPDQVWLGTEGMGILAVNPIDGTTRRIRHQADVADSLNDNDVNALFRERSGLIYAGTTGALSRHDPHPTAITTLRQSGAPLDGALSISSMMVRPDGRLWVGLPGGGIHIIDPRGGASGQIRPRAPGLTAGLPSGRVLSMASAPSGQAYLGTQHGVYRTDAKGNNPVPVSLASRRIDTPVWALRFHGDAFWLGGLDGLWVYAIENGAPGKLLRHETASLGESRVTAMLPTPEGAMWVGTRAGLARVDGAGGKLERIPTDATRADSLPPGYVSSLLVDGRARLWVAIFGGGIAVHEKTGADGRRLFRRIGTAEGMPHLGVNALQEDATGAIWASTDDGLAKIDPVTYKVTALGPAQGVHVQAYWTNSSTRTADGDLLFGGLTGLTVVRPARMRPWSYQAPLVVTDLHVNDAAVPEAPYNPAARLAGAAPAIAIAPQARERGFALGVAALDYSAPESNRYSYRLLGFDERWINADAETRRISYTNLPPGDYTLQLRGSNRDGAWSPLLALPVRALPAWHQTFGMRVLFALACAALLAALFRARTTYMRSRQSELEALIGERTAELQASQRQLEVLAYADPLTGLPNRRCFGDELRHMSARAVRENAGFTLLLVDLDYFKQVNDSMGHDAGDALLVEAARRLQLAVRESDRVARLGGDEFAVLLPLTADEAGAAIICARIVDSLAEPVHFGEHRITISASVGAATFSEAGGEPDALYKAADMALYETKRGGRNGWRWYRTA